MTVIGFHLLPGGRALAWADSEIFAEGLPSGHALKLAVNTLAGTVGIGTGLVSTLREGAELIAECLTFDEVSSRLPARLMQASRSRAEFGVAARSSEIWQAFAIVGFSHRFGRIVGTVFDDRRDFSPELAGSFLAPSIVDADEPQTTEAVIATAQLQLSELRRQNPGASGGVLIMAELQPDGITVRPLFDLSAGRMLRRPIEFSDPGVARRPDIESRRPGVSVVSHPITESNRDHPRPLQDPAARRAFQSSPGVDHER